MPTHAEVAAKLLVDAAGFFRNLAENNEPIKDQMMQNADVFEQVSVLVSQDPDGKVDDKSHAEMAGTLLKDAAGFFKTLAEQNEPIREQMTENAKIYEQVSGLVEENPQGEMQ